MNRKEFLRSLAGTSFAFGAFTTPSISRATAVAGAVAAPFKQEPLPYAFDALQPSIDKATMEIHYGKHHAGYVSNLNNAVKGTKYENMSLEEILKNIKGAPAAIRNNAGGHWNHSFFWDVMAPGKGGAPKGAVGDAINGQFGSFDKFKEAFGKEATGRFGSGWAWLAVQNGKLAVGSTPNQDNPMMDVADFKGTPVLGLDVWEHAYYLKYQNKRADYVSAFWDVVNWDKVNQALAKAK
ncbi:superoxide dismutase [Telluribacter sp.]|jgi:Fe-Mn family superoxide dismutase|uniref:superoxide dismutase n=1 Tax=Telluribacter sp. TaxID=1978767 RepID=UPI002E0DDB43|nr:superoxide dismutase [Telluribacter sp.]